MTATLQVGWIGVQLPIMQRGIVLQPVLLIVAALILLVAGLRATASR